MLEHLKEAMNAAGAPYFQPLIHELIEARDEKKLLRFQKQIASYELLSVDELGFMPLSKTGAELLFEMLSQRASPSWWWGSGSYLFFL